MSDTVSANVTPKDSIRRSRSRGRGNWNIGGPRKSIVGGEPKLTLDLARAAGRMALPDAIRLFIRYLQHEDPHVAMKAAAELCNRCGLPRQSESKQQVETVKTQVMIFPFSDPFPHKPMEVADVVEDDAIEAEAGPSAPEAGASDA